MTIVKLTSPDRRYKPPAYSIRDLPKGKVQQLQAVFNMLDTDRDGLLKEEEVVYAGKLLGVRIRPPQPLADDTPRSSISGFSAPADVGPWGFEDFAGRVATAMQRHHNDMDDMAYETEKLFNSIDKYQRGSVKASDVSAFFQSCGDTVSEELVGAMMDALDTSLMGEKASKAELRRFLETCEHSYTNPTPLRLPTHPFSMHQSLIEAQLNAGEHLESIRAEAEEDAEGGALLNLVAMSAGGAASFRSIRAAPPATDKPRKTAAFNRSYHSQTSGSDESHVSGSSRSSLTGSESSASSRSAVGGAAAMEPQGEVGDADVLEDPQCQGDPGHVDKAQQEVITPNVIDAAGPHDSGDDEL